MAPTRKERRRLVVVGVLFAVSISLGSLLAQTTVTTVLGLFIVAYVAAILASRVAFGAVVLGLCLPLCAVGLSYDDLAKAASIGLVLVAGSLVCFGLFLMWPESPRAADPPPQLLSRAVAHRYGLMLGLAGATSAWIGILINTDHVGWAPAAGYFVMRPSAEMQKVRSIGRIVSVAVGAAAAVVFLRTGPSDLAICLYGAVVVVAASATRTSRWYVTATFSSALVLTLLLYANATVAEEQWRFNERVGETVLGVAVAYFFGLVVPTVLDRWRRRRAGEASASSA